MILLQFFQSLRSYLSGFHTNLKGLFFAMSSTLVFASACAGTLSDGEAADRYKEEQLQSCFASVVLADDDATRSTRVNLCLLISLLDYEE